MSKQMIVALENTAVAVKVLSLSGMYVVVIAALMFKVAEAAGYLA